MVELWRFGENLVRVFEWQRRVETLLPNGRTVDACPIRSADYLETALRHGYGWHEDPAWAMCREHDALHVMLAVEMDLLTSWTLMDVAASIALEYVGEKKVPRYHWLEEGRVMDLQLYLNTGDRERTENYGAIFELSWEIDLPSFRARALELFR